MPETLANKIAAGEVVQRPASVAKELIENALDAGARHIDVILKSAGSELIQVVDDGGGMTPEDAVTCFKRHATSKIQDASDLERIATFGFRGEALASIASVAHVELRTKQVDADAGTLIRVEGGVTAANEPCATANGTSIAVRNLFYNVPARRNFLKSPATEFKHVVDTFQVMALANPDVGFRLVHDDAEVVQVPPVDDTDRHRALFRRIRALLGDDFATRTYRVEETTSYLSVRGVIGHSDFNRRTRGDQYLFVNGRHVKSRYIDHAVTSAYEGLLPDGSFPFFALFLQLDPRHIDVNVHPTKAEIKFDDERGVYAFVKSVVRRTLGKEHLTPQMDEASAMGGSAFGRSFDATQSGTRPFDARPFEDRPFEARPFAAGASGTSPSAKPFLPTPSPGSDGSFGDGARAERPSWHPSESPGELSARLYGGPFDSTPVEMSDAASPTTDDAAGPQDDRLLWQLHEKYILTQIKSGLMVLDQNAAHERVLYEQALQSMENGMGLSQQLLFPHTVEFSAPDFELFKELIDDFRSLGFDVEPFSGRSVVIRGVPAEIRAGDERTVLRDILDQYKAYRQGLQIKGKENLAKSIARRSAIRPGVRLTTKEMRGLIDQLFDCEMPYACPHGRPTLIKIPIEELDKRFGR